MRPSERRRQKAMERKATMRGERAPQVAPVGERTGMVASRPSQLSAAANWPVHEVLISEGWNQTQGPPGLTQVLVARRAPSGEVGMGLFLVDLGCLGVKNAMGKVFSSVGAYSRWMRRIEAGPQTMAPTNLDLAAKVIQEGIAYARSLGFEPHRDYYLAAPLLEGAHPEAAAESVPLGYRGKPFYVSGPNDNPKRIIKKLAETVGVGNFDYIAHVSPAELGIEPR